MTMYNYLTQCQEDLNNFYSIKEKPYNEIELELKIIEIESELSINLSLNEKILLEKLILTTKQLQKVQDERLVEYIKKIPPR